MQLLKQRVLGFLHCLGLKEHNFGWENIKIFYDLSNEKLLESNNKKYH